jgi:hypothetical protein
MIKNVKKEVSSNPETGFRSPEPLKQDKCSIFIPLT